MAIKSIAPYIDFSVHYNINHMSKHCMSKHSQNLALWRSKITQPFTEPP